jgi:hypothetical protein
MEEILLQNKDNYVATSTAMAAKNYMHTERGKRKYMYVWHYVNVDVRMDVCLYGWMTMKVLI